MDRRHICRLSFEPKPQVYHCTNVFASWSLLCFLFTERYHSLDTKMKSNPLSLEEVSDSLRRFMCHCLKMHFGWQQYATWHRETKIAVSRYRAIQLPDLEQNSEIVKKWSDQWETCSILFWIVANVLKNRYLHQDGVQCFSPANTEVIIRIPLKVVNFLGIWGSFSFPKRGGLWSQSNIFPVLTSTPYLFPDVMLPLPPYFPLFCFVRLAVVFEGMLAVITTWFWMV
jgi:hypothetical protein